MTKCCGFLYKSPVNRFFINCNCLCLLKWLIIKDKALLLDYTNLWTLFAFWYFSFFSFPFLLRDILLFKYTMWKRKNLWFLLFFDTYFLHDVKRKKEKDLGVRSLYMIQREENNNSGQIIKRNTTCGYMDLTSHE